MAQGLIVKVKNNSGSTISRGKLVYITGFDETVQMPTIGLADYSSSSRLPAVGAVVDDIENGQTGIARVAGLAAGFDTSSVTINTDIYTGSNGGIVFLNPVNDGSYISQRIGIVSTSDENGQIFLFPMEIQQAYSHPALTNVLADQHHSQLHATSHIVDGNDDISKYYLNSIIYTTTYGNHSQAQNTTYYYPLQGSLEPTSSDTEAYYQIKMRRKGRLKKMRCYVKTNTLNVTATLKLRKNGSDGKQNILISAGNTGAFEDTSNEDAYITDDLICYELTAPLGSGAISLTLIQIENVAN